MGAAREIREPDMSNGNGSVYLRRVKDPNPMLEELARQVCDQIDKWEAEVGSPVRPIVVGVLAADAGVPLEYVLDERERRVRAARTPEKSEGR